ncbi:hypothetical protein [Streptomyces akebiae]|uniref:Uncharacterized protein n=1 Tax=Streptomyces akebiae TaxID=2865673 RepID=A0ABX8Y0R7_9ACTN|nr:hypothetical protein [Streptomyces akebiae]QYX81773.1 hypothetical protein K1J60_39085 [Streptomyces akebiae]
MVLRLIRCALAIRDAEGEELIAQEMLEQVRLPLKTAAAELLTQAGMLRPRTAPPPDGLAGAVLRGLCVLGHYGNPMPRLSRMAEQP